MPRKPEPRWKYLDDGLETRESRTPEGDEILDFLSGAVMSADDMGPRPEDADEAIAALKRLEWVVAARSPKATDVSDGEAT